MSPPATIAAAAPAASQPARPRRSPAPGRLDARRCISYLTIEHAGPIPHEFREAIGNRIYGCDDCLAVCPWNRFASAAQANKAFAPRPELVAPALADLLALDDAAFPRTVLRIADQADRGEPDDPQLPDCRGQQRRPVVASGSRAAFVERGSGRRRCGEVGDGAALAPASSIERGSCCADSPCRPGCCGRRHGSTRGTPPPRRIEIGVEHAAGAANCSLVPSPSRTWKPRLAEMLAELVGRHPVQASNGRGGRRDSAGSRGRGLTGSERRCGAAGKQQRRRAGTRKRICRLVAVPSRWLASLPEPATTARRAATHFPAGFRFHDPAPLRRALHRQCDRRRDCRLRRRFPEQAGA